MEATFEGRRVFLHTGGVEPDLSGDVVLLVHGAANDHTIWRYQTRWLAGKGLPVLALDLPGHGKTEGPPLERIEDMAAWTFALCDSLGVDGVYVVGHSMGSLVAMQMAASRSDRVRAICLWATAAHMRVHPDLLAASIEQPALATDLIVGWTHSGRSRFGSHAGPGMWMTGLTRRLNDRFADVRPVDLAACAAWDGASVIGSIRAPALVFVGSADRMTPAGDAREVARMLPSAEFVQIPGGSHASVYDHPDEVDEVVWSWLRRVWHESGTGAPSD